MTSHRSKAIVFLHVFYDLTDGTRRHPDAYHTLYCLSGLSAAQHRLVQSAPRRTEVQEIWKDTEGGHRLAYLMVWLR